MSLLFVNLEEVLIPNLKYCIECNKPISGKSIICDFCNNDGEKTTADKFNYEFLLKGLSDNEKKQFKRIYNTNYKGKK
jgi:hypothetical protein